MHNIIGSINDYFEKKQKAEETKIMEMLLSPYMICIYVIFIIVCIIFYFKSRRNTSIVKSEPDWNEIAQKKWKNIQLEICCINGLHDRAYGGGKRIGNLEKKKVKNELDENSSYYYSFVDFCVSKNVDLTDEQKEIGDAINRIKDALENPKAALDKELNRTKMIYDEKYEELNDVGNILLENKKSAVELIDEIEGLINSISKRPREFDVNLSTITTKKDKFKDTLYFGEKAKKELEKSMISVGVGVATGTAVATVGPSAAMWVATTFGTASTGTAISALSGASATNAALAWLGGGTIAAGGGGIAAGQALLAMAGPIGLGIAGTTLFATIIYRIFKGRKIENDKKEEIISIKRYTEAIKELKVTIIANNIELVEMKKQLKKEVNQMSRFEGCEYPELRDDEKMQLGALVNNTLSLVSLVNRTIGQEDE